MRLINTLEKFIWREWQEVYKKQNITEVGVLLLLTVYLKFKIDREFKIDRYLKFNMKTAEVQ